MATVRYKRDLKALEQRRRKGMRMLARDVMQAEVARELGVSRQTVSNWERERLADAQAWRRKPLGRPAALDARQKRALAARLQRGAIACGFPTELWTLQRIRALIERDFGVRFSTANVWLLLRSLGFSSQRPVGRAIQRDEAAIRDWKQRRWPALKKSAAPRAARSSSSTSRD
jgi:transposase